MGLLGVIFGAIGLAKSKKANAGKGLAIAGLVLGGLAIVFAIIINVAFVSAVDESLDEVTDTSVEAPAGEKSAQGDDKKKPSKAGTTRSNPAPLGSKVTGGDWTMKVNSVKKIEQDSLGSKAADGSILLLVNLTTTYNGDDEQGGTPWATLKFVTADGKTIDSIDGSTLFIPENSFDSLGTVFEGASIEGDQIVEVPADDWQKGVLAVSPNLLSDDTFIALN